MPGVDSMQIQFIQQVLNNNNHWQQNFLVLKKPRFRFIQAITMVFILDSPKKWIETAFTESVSTRSLPWLAENTFADRTDQMFIRLINKVYKDTHRLSVQNTFTPAKLHNSLETQLSNVLYHTLYNTEGIFLRLQGFLDRN